MQRILSTSQTPLPIDDPNYQKPQNRLLITRENTDQEQREIDYLEEEINPILCKILPSILVQKP